MMESAELERIDKMLKASGLAGKVFKIEDSGSDWTIGEVTDSGSWVVGSGENRAVAWLYANAPQMIDELLTEVNRLRNVSQAYMVLNGDFDN